MKTVGFVVAGWAVGAVNAKIAKWGRDSNEREYKPAQETLGFMPALLNAPAPMTTSPPRADYPLYCDATAYCASNSINSHVGCCPDAATTSCNVWTTCLDSTEQAAFTTDNGFTLWCGFTSYPHCITHIYRDTAGAATALRGYTLLGCAVAAGTDSVYYNPFIFSTSSSRRTTSFPIAPTVTTSTSSATTNRATTTVTQSSTPVPVSSSAPVGAIAGGVVGGVAAISLIIFGIWFLIRQNNKSKDDIGAQPPTPGAPPAFAGYNNGAVGGTPATQMPQPANGYFAPAQHQPEVAAVGAGAGFAAAAMGMAAHNNQRNSIAKPGFETQTQPYQYNAPPQGGGLGINSSPPPPVYQGTPSSPLGSAGADGRYSAAAASVSASGYGQGQGQSGAGSPRDDRSGMGYAAAGGYHHRESRSTQGGYQGQQGVYEREGGGYQQQQNGEYEWDGYQQQDGGYGQDGYPQQDGGYGRDGHHAAAAPLARESYQQQPQSGHQQESHNQPPPRETYQQPPAQQQRPEPTYQVERGYQQQPPSPQGPPGGGYQSQNPQPPTNYHPPQPVYQPYPTGGYRNEHASELPTVRGDGEVRELP
ncbi:hypothetical protein B0T14DRAFT_279402 [Immersiella caudata]|uniref:Uncharacterized protein n=1 Tax=Immersiella caudata TaxID=314043 RepID=A0AA40BTU8_9PEZI|nr:hypothetical protein B0T14DRAFT_279402 [Immersiella caudata]